MTEERGIKEITEIIDALELTVDTAAKALEDGELGLSDITHALDLVKQYEKFIEAVRDAGEVIDEAKDISEDEAIVLGMRVYAMLKKIGKLVKQAKELK